jgi:hypothetical protein
MRSRSSVSAPESTSVARSGPGGKRRPDASVARFRAARGFPLGGARLPAAGPIPMPGYNAVPQSLRAVAEHRPALQAGQVLHLLQQQKPVIPRARGGTAEHPAQAQKRLDGGVLQAAPDASRSQRGQRRCRQGAVCSWQLQKRAFSCMPQTGQTISPTDSGRMPAATSSAALCSPFVCRSPKEAGDESHAFSTLSRNHTPCAVAEPVAGNAGRPCICEGRPRSRTMHPTRADRNKEGPGSGTGRA